MADKQFIYAPANPIRLVPIAATDPLYDTLPFDLWEDDECYKQPWKANESTTLQVLSDWLPTFKIFDANTGLEVKDCPAVAKTISIIGETYTCYEIVIDWTGVPNGRYYCDLTYENDLLQTVLYRSGLQELKTTQPKTIRIEYKNSENDFSVIYETGIVFALRVQAAIKDYTPEFEDVTYDDQYHNATLLNSVYYDQFKFYAPGYGGFIPAWMAKRINIALSNDSVKLDGVYYQRIEGSKWDVQRVAEKDIMGISIDIVPVDNLFTKRIKTGTDPNTGNIQIVRKSLQYLNQAANLAISSVFKKYTNLAFIGINNINNIPFTLLVGTTNGGQELGLFDIGTEDNATCGIEALFNGAETVYLTGLTGVVGLSVDISIVYDQLDAPPITLPFTLPDQLGKGACMRYKELMPGDVISAFDLGSGLGITSTKWEKWAIADGRNGGSDESSCVAVMYDPTNTDYDALDATGGANTITLTTSQLPNFFLKMFGNDVRNAAGDAPNATQRAARARAAGGDSLNYEVSRSTNTDDTNMIGRTSSIGSGDAIDARMKYVVGLTIVKIAD